MNTHVILGTGAVGTALANQLHAQGHTVRSVNRSGNRGSLDPAVELLAGDLTDAAFVASALRDATVTYQVTQPAYHRWADEFPALQARIIDAAAAAGSRLVIADNLYAYGDPAGATITEDSPQHPNTKKGRVRKAMADAALAAHEAGRLEVAISRPSNYFGPGYALTQGMVVGNAKLGKPMRFLGATDQPHSYSYVPDVATTMAAMGTSDTAWGKAWVAPVMEPITVADLAARIWAAAGRDGKPTVQAIRGLGLRALGLVSPAIRETIEMMYEFEEPFIVDSSRAEAAFGVTPTEWDEAIGAAIAAA